MHGIQVRGLVREIVIEQVTIGNFRSFGSPMTVQLGPFNVFIGPNASGKSNFVDAFRFLQDAIIGNLEPAVARRYGWSNLKCRRRRNNTVQFSLSGKLTRDLGLSSGKRHLVVADAAYAYELEFSWKNAGGSITKEAAKLNGVVRRANGKGGKTTNGQVGEARSAFARTEDTVRVMEHIAPDVERATVHSVSPTNRGRLFASSNFVSLAALVVNGEVEGWRFHDPNPQLVRQPQYIEEVGGISESGDTLALVLHRLRDVGERGDGREQALLSLAHTLIPGFENWETEQLADGRIAFKVRETGLRGSLPSSLLSDGTVRLLAILAALLLSDEEPSAIFIEEPERSLHPAVLATLVDVMRQVAAETQIIVTTHSADFVRHCRPEEVYLMDKVDGSTQVVQAGTIGQIDEFLQHFTLDQLWLQGHLERGIP